MTKWDKILITFIIIISLGSIGAITYYKSQAETLYGIIELEGKEIDRINLLTVEKPYEIKLENGEDYNIVRVEKGRIAFIDATCPDKDCIEIGWLSGPGETSVCLPNKAIIRIESPKVDKEEIDSTTY
ncbi:NusG domain II-containing protein [Irregularibacter muris]|uniref:NusG domain II-containing protein n=1 Tax=Irregularibacter muris TaxID=1796619 RepID=A0AAE3L082_9FIRM|nr:NusG domain II-containing protein [Irregularibacter muris]MCR1899896.1 NusG domain II-containing protein [Irregularibacter muris]